MRVAILAFPTSLKSGVAIAADVLDTANSISMAARRKPPFSIRHVRCGPRTDATMMAGADLVIVPGIGISSEKQLLTALDSPTCRRAGDLLIHARRTGAALAVSCASTFVLADTGLLNGRRATTTWWLAGAFRRRFPQVILASDEIVVPDWPLATAGAAMAQIDIMLAIVAKFARPALADDCARYLLLDKRPSQAAFVSVTQLAAQDSRIARAESWIRVHIANDFTINDVASAVALTPRTFSRRLEAVCGLSPVRFVQRIRIEIARTLLETTRLSVEEVAQRVGYAEPSTLRRLLRRETHRAPLSFRTPGAPSGVGRLKRV